MRHPVVNDSDDDYDELNSERETEEMQHGQDDGPTSGSNIRLGEPLQELLGERLKRQPVLLYPCLAVAKKRLPH